MRHALVQHALERLALRAELPDRGSHAVESEPQLRELALGFHAPPHFDVVGAADLIPLRRERGGPRLQLPIRLALLELADPSLGLGQTLFGRAGGLRPARQRSNLGGVTLDEPPGLGVVLRQPSSCGGQLLERPPAFVLQGVQPADVPPVRGAGQVGEHVHLAECLYREVFGGQRMGHHRPVRPWHVTLGEGRRPERVQRLLGFEPAANRDHGAVLPIQQLLHRLRHAPGLPRELHEVAVELVFGRPGGEAKPGLAGDLAELRIVIVEEPVPPETGFNGRNREAPHPAAPSRTETPSRTNSRGGSTTPQRPSR